jgi:hypothetical protein
LGFLVLSFFGIACNFLHLLGATAEGHLGYGVDINHITMLQHAVFLAECDFMFFFVACSANGRRCHNSPSHGVGYGSLNVYLSQLILKHHGHLLRLLLCVVGRAQCDITAFMLPSGTDL